MNEITHILADPAHWVGEAVMDSAFALAMYPLAKWRVRVHDRKTHKTDS